ncbi:unnamed protein product, partial [Ixodes pacificus]
PGTTGAHLKDEALDLVVEDQHEGPARAAEDVGEGALEEGCPSFRLQDLAPAMDRALVLPLLDRAAALHHHAPPHRVERVRDDARHRRDRLRYHPGDDQWRVLGV